jgi:BirA family biotin operon repressor/biotin-[acetyl-CoA-carboxylase] ligase
MHFTILRFDSIDSTNIEALKQARQGAEEGLCLVARQQTAGRGRQGRSWTSAMDAGLYASIILRPQIDVRRIPMITLASAIAVFETLVSLGLSPDIKWPNDVLINEKKICGILAETTETDRGMAVVVGIGINITVDSIPANVAENATSVNAELGQAVTPADIEPILLDRFQSFYELLCGTGGAESIVDEWTTRSTYAKGKQVRVKLSKEMITGLTDGLEPDGALRLRTSDGSIHVIHAGDVERLRADE